MISVIITSYNKGKFVKKCLESVFAQSFKDYEVIVVDDLSTDNSREIIEEYKDRVVFIKNRKNLGPGASRDKAIKKASGEYITFLDADDWLDPDFLETLDEYSYNFEADIVYSVLRVINQSGKVLGEMGNRAYYTDKVVDPEKGNIWAACRYSFQNLCGALIRKSLFDSKGYCNSRYAEDTVTGIYLNYRSSCTFLSSYSGYNYLQLPDSLTHIADSYDGFYFTFHNLIWALNGVKRNSKEDWIWLKEKAKEYIEKQSIQLGRVFSDYEKNDKYGWWDEIRDYYNVSEKRLSDKKKYIERTRSKVIHLS